MNILAIEPSRYGHKAVLVDCYGNTLDSYQGRAGQYGTHWVHRFLDKDPELSVVGSPLDDWPEELIDELRRSDAPLNFLNPSLMRRLFTVCRPWNLERKLHRVRFLAYLYHRDTQYSEAEQEARLFERDAARRLLYGPPVDPL
jgi:hypothetical protein